MSISKCSMSNWIFVMAGNESKFLERIREEKWSIYSRTSNRNKIKSGDSVLFYLAGPHRKKIIASSVLDSELKKEKENFTIALAKIDVWKKHIPVQSLVDSLDFIKNKVKWGVHMHGGVVHLSDKDYDLIIGTNQSSVSSFKASKSKSC